MRFRRLEDAVERRERAGAPACPPCHSGACERRGLADEQGPAQSRFLLEQRPVVLDERQRPGRVAGAHPAGRATLEERRRQSVDLGRGDALAGECLGGRAKERRGKPGATARLVGPGEGEQQALAGRLHREPELEGLRVGAARAQGQRAEPQGPELEPLAVEEQRILAWWGREAALHEAEDTDATEAQVAERVDVEDVHSATGERAAPPVLDVRRAQVLDLGAHDRQEAGELHCRTESIELPQGIEVAEDRVGVIDEGVQDAGQVVERLAPARRRGVAGERLVERLDAGAQVTQVGGPAPRATRGPRARASLASVVARRRSRRSRHCWIPSTTPALRERLSQRAAGAPPKRSRVSSGMRPSVRKVITSRRRSGESKSASRASTRRPSGRSASGAPSCRYKGMPASANTASTIGR